MSIAMKPAPIVLIAVLLVGTSCTRAPQDDQESPSDNSVSTPDNVSVASETDSHPGDPSAADFVVVEIDLNSGDLRGTRHILDGPPRYVIYESELSKEVRRLGIPIPEERKWFIIWGQSDGEMGFTYVYQYLPSVARRLLTVLNESEAMDQERRDVLERLMTSVRTEKPPGGISRARMLIVEVCDRHGLESPLRH